ncbi:MAG: hypothetical protein JAY88_14615 [Candidatus Thiodiazotropha lotti]|nr:hypothetical protein [Candidatus Thiodiazotropha lotti]MCW4188296.1 hypothetical protein [Candidatus Thiodiazotropha lotti]
MNTPKVRPTDLGEFASDLDAGIFGEKVAHFISDIAQAVVSEELNAKAIDGKLTLTFTMKRFGTTGSQVMVTHKLDAKIPTTHGHVNEIETKQTAMYVNEGGKTTFFMENQGQMFSKEGETNPS